MYFEKEGKENSRFTIELAVKMAKERNIPDIVVASTTGETAALLRSFDGNVVCVSHAYGFAKADENEMPDKMRKTLTEAGIKILTAAHVLSGAERGLSNRFSGVYPVEIIANTLRMFGQGTKVCVECATMALDAGLIPYGRPVISIGGTTGGADTAIILIPAYASHILDTKINEIICKPSLLSLE